MAEPLPAPSPSAAKQDWRRWSRQTRAGLDLGAASVALAESLAIWPLLRTAATVLLYLPLSDEISVTALVTSFPDTSFFVTRTPARGGRLSVHPLDGPLERHPYGFEQPTAEARAVDPAEVEIWLVPGLAFDRMGNRLGRGAGYFDELASRAPKSVRVGVSPAACVVERLPTEPHDMPVHHLATEQGVVSAVEG